VTQWLNYETSLIPGRAVGKDSAARDPSQYVVDISAQKIEPGFHRQTPNLNEGLCSKIGRRNFTVAEEETAEIGWKFAL